MSSSRAVDTAPLRKRASATVARNSARFVSIPPTRISSSAAASASIAPGRSDACTTTLREQRVVVRRDLGAEPDPRVDARVPRRDPFGHGPCARPVSVHWVFGVDAHLDRRSVRTRRRRELGERREIAASQPDHPLDQVDAQHHLRHRVLDLEARVHLEERVLTRGRVDDELDRAGGAVPHRCAQRDRRAGERGARCVVETGRGRLLDHLLVAPLDRAVTLAERDHLAAAVAEDLHLDVPGGDHEAFDEAPAVAEVTGREPGDGVEGLRERVFGVAAAHADAAAPGATLEHHGVPDDGCCGEGVVAVTQHGAAREQRDAGPERERSGGVLAPERIEVFGRGADPRDAGGLARAREPGVFRQEAVPGMQRVRAGVRGRGEEALTVEVALARRGRPEADRLVGEVDVRRVPIRIRVDRDRREPEAADRREDPHRDLAPVRHEDLPHRHARPLTRPTRAAGSGWGSNRCTGC